MITSIINFYKIKMIFVDLKNFCLNNLSKKESVAFELAKNDINDIIAKHKSELSRVAIYIYENGPCPRIFSSFPGEKFIRSSNLNFEDHFKITSVDFKKGLFLLLVSHRLRAKKILEIGSAFGASANYIIRGILIKKRGHLTCVENSECFLTYLEENLEKFSEKKIVDIIKDDIIKVLEEGTLKGKYDLIFIDAVHQRNFNLTIFKFIPTITKRGSIIIFDDVESTKEMREMWHEVSSKKEVFYSCELENLGILIMN